jgi:hypothetical protein
LRVYLKDADSFSVVFIARAINQTEYAYEHHHRWQKQNQNRSIHAACRRCRILGIFKRLLTHRTLSKHWFKGEQKNNTNSQKNE